MADPLYTAPFLICLVILMFYTRMKSKRRFWLKLVIGVSSIYMLCALFNKVYKDNVFKETLANKQINYFRFSTQPTILNNILRYSIAETETNYQVGFYSLLDKPNCFIDWKVSPKQRFLRANEHEDLKYLVAWFSNGYYNVESLNAS